MTKIKYKIKPTWHEAQADYMGRALLVAQTPHNILLRRKGTRQTLTLPLSVAFLKAAQMTEQTIRINKISRGRI
jgi:hypothetical protein